MMTGRVAAAFRIYHICTGQGDLYPGPRSNIAKEKYFQKKGGGGYL